MPTLLALRGRPPLLAALTVTAALSFAAPAESAQRAAAAELLRLVNATRAAHGVAPVRSSPRLTRAASGHSRDMVAHHYFAHRSPAGKRPSDRIAASGWMRGRRRWWIGENLAWGRGAYERPAAVVAAWLGSPAHRRVLLGRVYTAVGIGAVRGTPGSGPGAGLTYTADFGG